MRGLAFGLLCNCILFWLESVMRRCILWNLEQRRNSSAASFCRLVLVMSGRHGGVRSTILVLLAVVLKHLKKDGVQLLCLTA